MPEIVQQEIFAPSPFVERGKSIVIAGDPKGKNFLYTNSKTVIIREVENPKKCDAYSEHTNKVTVAKYAPSGYYICSGDATGKIRIWDTMDTEHKLKNEFRPFSGEIRDLVWGPESKRIAICGQGSDKHAVVIMWDSANTVGKLDQVMRRGNSIDYKPTRPFRIAIGDDESVVSVYEGPPFKSKFELRDHTRFANSVRYSPDGQYFASGSSDGHVFLYDAKTSEKVGQLGDEKKGAHGGGVYSLAWSPDSKELLTASGDKTARIWNVETRQEVVKFVLGTTVDDQQYSCLWTGDTLLTVALSGNITYLDRNNPEKPLRILYGHNRPMTTIINVPGDKRCHVSGDTSGKILIWDTENGEARPFAGSGHTNKISGLAYDAASNEIISTGWDDKIRFTCATAVDFSSATTISLSSQPTILSLAGDGYVVVLATKSIILIKDKKVVSEIEHDEDYTPHYLSAYGSTVAVSRQNGGVKLYNIDGNSLVDAGTDIEDSKQALILHFSPDGSMLVVTYDNRILHLYMVADGYKCQKQLIGHHQRVTVVSWSPNSQFLSSTGIDGRLRVWNIATDAKDFEEHAHSHSHMNALAWQSDDTLVSAGDDILTKVWKITW